MKHLVLFPDWRVLDEARAVFEERFPKENHMYFFVTESSRKLEGVRFKDVYVHWFCYDEPNYDVYVSMILQARAFAAERGETYLFT